MPTTPVYQLPYPAASDPANVPLDMQELADATEAAIKTLVTNNANATSDLTLTTTYPTYQNVPGAVVTRTLARAGILLVTATWDAAISAAGADAILGGITVNGSLQSGTVIFTATARASICRSWAVAVAAGAT